MPYFNFLYANFFTDIKKEELKYILFFGLFFDIFLYHLPLINTILFIILYIINRKAKCSNNIIIYIIKSLFNLLFIFLFYSLITSNFSLLITLWPSYLINIITSCFFYKFKKKTFEFRKS